MGLDPTLYPIVGEDQCPACGNGPLPIRRKHCDKHCNFVMRRRVGSQRVCVWCGQSGKVRPDRSHCDRDCLDAHRDAQSKSEEKTCRHCGKVRSNRSRMFCNIDCSRAHFVRSVCAVPSCDNTAKNYHNKCCSLECAGRLKKIQNGNLRRTICIDCGNERAHQQAKLGRCLPCRRKQQKWLPIHRMQKRERGSGGKLLFQAIADLLLKERRLLSSMQIRILLPEKWGRFIHQDAALAWKMRRDKYRRFQGVSSGNRPIQWGLHVFGNVCARLGCDRWTVMGQKEREGPRQYCSNTCAGKCVGPAPAAMMTLPCGHCGDPVTRQAWQIEERLRKSKTGAVYCNTGCAGRARGHGFILERTREILRLAEQEYLTPMEISDKLKMAKENVYAAFRRNGIAATACESTNINDGEPCGRRSLGSRYCHFHRKINPVIPFQAAVATSQGIAVGAQ